MSILITGGLGYIGSHIYIELIHKNINNIIIVDNLSNSNIEQKYKLEKITNTKINLYTYDLLDFDNIYSLFENNNIKYVIHLAGLKIVNQSINNPLLYYSNNITLLLTIIKIMEIFDCKNFIFSSSASIYGSSNTSVKETDNIILSNINNPYGKTKYMQEQILSDLYNSDKSWNITVLRYFNPVGNHNSGLIGDNLKLATNILPSIINSIINNNTLFIYGSDYNTIDGTCLRDFIHVVDLANAHISCLTTIKGYNIYNVGTGKPISILELIKTFEQINNIKLNYQIIGRRNGDLEYSCADNTKIINELHWTPKNTLNDICKDSYTYYKKLIL